ncbi:MAG: MarR family transcriptional regulator [Clostridia bacterium]|nr:MarR family transcriptional regulator [Clostridia bacterium]
MMSRFEQFSFAISGIYRCIQKIERDEMVAYGFKGAYAQYLAAMSRFPEGVTAAQLCDICEKDKAAVSRAVAEMEDKGLLVREGTSGYRAPLKLTAQGLDAADFVCQRAQAAVAAAGHGLTDEKRSVFYEALGLIASNLQRISREGIPDNEE